MKRLSLRARLVWLGSSWLALGLVLSGLLLVHVLDRALRSATDKAALHSAHDVALLVNSEQLPDPLPVNGSGVIVQVVDSSGRVLAGSAGADRLVPMLRREELARARTGVRFTISGDRVSDEAGWRVVGVEAGPSDKPYLVLVAVPAAQSTTSVRFVRNAMLVLFPVFVLGAAAASWFSIGRVLRPVEALRSGAERISAASGSQRLPVPASRDEIHRLAVTLNDMLDRLSQAQTRQRAFVADAAHELRSPLASVRTQLEVAQRLDDMSVAAEALSDVERLGNVVDDLLLLARADEGQATPHAHDTDVTELVTALVATYGRARVPVTLVRERGSDAGPVRAVLDPTHLRRVLTNLVDNAVRHAATQVRVHMRQTAHVVRFSVVDDGPGIPMEEREHVFHRFTRLDDGRARDVGGTGLGLSIVRELTRLAGGTVVLGDAHPGLRVEVRLPRHVSGGRDQT